MAENILLYSAEKDFQEENPANGFCFIDTMEEKWEGETESSKQLDHLYGIYFTTDSRQEDFKLKTILLIHKTLQSFLLQDDSYNTFAHHIPS